jgi:WD40 repeat protein
MSVALTLDNLPAGFEKMPDDELRAIEEEFPADAIAYGFQDDKRSHKITVILISFSDQIEQDVFDSMLPATVQVMVNAYGAKNDSMDLSGLDDIGESRAGRTALSKVFILMMRLQSVAFRRNQLGVIIFRMYPDGDDPVITMEALARMQDDRIQDFLASNQLPSTSAVLVPTAEKSIQSWVRSIDWSDDGSLMVAGSAKGCVLIWETQTWAVTDKITDIPGFVRSVDISPDGVTLATGNDVVGIELWDLRTGDQYSHDSLGAPLGYLAWKPDGKQLAFTEEDNNISIVDIDSFQTISLLGGKHTGLVTGIVWSSDGLRLASSSADSTVVIWDVEAATPILQLSGYHGWVDDLDWSPDGKIIAAGDDDGSMILWDTRTGKIIKKLEEHYLPVYSVAWSPDGKLLATGGLDDRIILWNPQTGENLNSYAANSDGILSLAWSPDGSFLAAGTGHDSVLILDLDKQEFVQTLHMDCPDTQDAEFYFQSGLDKLNQGNLDGAISDFNQAIQLNPDDGVAYYNRGVTYFEKGDLDRAISDFDRAIQLKPNLAEAYYNRGYIYHENGDLDRAISDYDRFIQLRPDYDWVYVNRGIAYYDKGDLDRAISDFDQAIQLNPNQAEAYYHRGIAYAQKGMKENAVADLRKVLTLCGNSELCVEAKQQLVIMGEK